MFIGHQLPLPADLQMFRSWIKEARFRVLPSRMLLWFRTSLLRSSGAMSGLQVPGNALDVSVVTQWVVAIIGVVFVVLDIFDAINIKSEWVVRLLVFSGSALLIASLLERGEQREQREENNTNLTHVTRGQDRVNDEMRMMLQRLNALSSEAEARQIPGSDIGEGLTDLLSTSKSWKYRDASGGWLRQRTLPQLANVKKAEVPVNMQILDPRDRDLCIRYATYRRNQQPKPLLSSPGGSGRRRSRSAR